MGLNVQIWYRAGKGSLDQKGGKWVKRGGYWPVGKGEGIFFFTKQVLDHIHLCPDTDRKNEAGQSA